jgi:hypothetical protein
VLATALTAYHWRHAVGAPRPRDARLMTADTLPILGSAFDVPPNLWRIHDWVLDKQRARAAAHPSDPAAGERSTFAFSLPFMKAFASIRDPACLEWVLRVNAANYVKGRHFRTNFGALLGRWGGGRGASSAPARANIPACPWLRAGLWRKAWRGCESAHGDLGAGLQHHPAAAQLHAPHEANTEPRPHRGIFAVDGEEWRWQRKLAARIFSVQGWVVAPGV